MFWEFSIMAPYHPLSCWSKQTALAHFSFQKESMKLNWRRNGWWTDTNSFPLAALDYQQSLWPKPSGLRLRQQLSWTPDLAERFGSLRASTQPRPPVEWDHGCAREWGCGPNPWLAGGPEAEGFLGRQVSTAKEYLWSESSSESSHNEITEWWHRENGTFPCVFTFFFILFYF